MRQGEAEPVPELAELARAVAPPRRHASRCSRSAKDYFAALFEPGVTPLRLATDEDRTKLNDMLRTSMTGGISRALTTELRAFLLKEETGLGDTLSRMRENLDACRRTRIEVGEARQLEQEISGVYDAGQAMFAAAVQAAQDVADEARARADEATAARAGAEHAVADLAERAAALTSRQASLEGRLAAAQAEVERATQARDRRAAARTAAVRLAELADEVAVRATLVEQTRTAQAAAAAERTARKLARTRAAEAYDQASHGLAHLQAGLDELHRRAHAHRTFGRRLAEATQLLGRAITVDEVAAIIGSLTADQERLDGERARLERLVRDADARAANHDQAAGALAALEAAVPPERSDAGDPGGDRVHERARAVLARLAAARGAGRPRRRAGPRAGRGRAARDPSGGHARTGHRARAGGRRRRCRRRGAAPPRGRRGRAPRRRGRGPRRRRRRAGGGGPGRQSDGASPRAGQPRRLVVAGRRAGGAPRRHRGERARRGVRDRARRGGLAGRHPGGARSPGRAGAGW